MELDYKKLHDEFKLILAEIKKASRIVVYRHEVPDYDALGTQMGLVTFLKENYPEKEIHYVGEGHKTFIPRIFPEPEHLDESFYEKPYLAICCDTGNTKRISEFNPKNATKVIKFDHHPNVEPYGDINCVYDTMGSCAELVGLFLFSMKKKKEIISKECATYLYIGIVGDTGRFMYPDCSSMTMRVAADLLDCGVDKEDVYSRMYYTSFEQLEFQKWVLNNYHITDKGTCYYVIDKEMVKKLNILPGEGKLHINLFRNVDGVKCVASITEDEAKNEWRVSLRGTTKVVSGVATKFNGGGHDFAAGAKLKDISELQSLIDALDEVEEA